MNVKQGSEEKRELPPGWRYARLAEISTIRPGQHVMGADHNTGRRGIGYLTGPADFGIEKAKISKWTEYPKVYAEPGDILITVKGAGVGKTNLAPDEKVAIGRQLMAVCGREEFVRRDYLYHFVRTQLRALSARALGATVPGLGRQDLEMILVPLPPVSEQKRIAGILNERMAAIDNARAAAEAQLEAARALPAAYLRQVFPRLGQELPSGWRLARLGELCDVQLGKMLSPKSKIGLSSFPYLRNANVQWNKIDTGDIAYMDFNEKEQKKFSLLRGDLLICEGGEPGRAAIWDGRIDPCFYQKSLHRVRPKCDSIDRKFALYRMWIGVLRREFTSANVKTTIAHLPAIRLESLEIPLPVLSEQKKLVAQLDGQMASAGRLQATLERGLAELNALPQALLRQAFRGEL